MAAASQGVASDAETLPFVVGTLDVALSQSFASTPGAGTTNESLKEVSRGRTLTVEVAKGGLSKLGYTPDSIKLVYLDLNISAHNLGDINMLTSFPHLQSLDVSYNVLRDLAPLSCLPNLNSINASHNKLTRLLDFDPPHSLLFVDYSYNEIEEIPDLTPFSSIKVLNLGGNQITELTGLSGLTSLSTLIVSDNRIERIQGLDNLPIENLDLSSNSIVSVTNLDLLKLLQVVNFSGNQIHSLKGLSHHSYLSVINMAENQIVGLDEVLHLKDIQSLETLDLRKNPLQTLADYRQTVMTQLTTLRVLDGQSLTVEEKVAANNRESSPLEVVAGHHHLQLMCKAARKATRLNFSWAIFIIMLKVSPPVFNYY
uniref:Protein phosphatase 1 regulatory subunit 7 n=1 Tax=Amphimedon queenslandica TaxID=400682 RepID=A0A1X7VCL3_AMPQE